MKKGLLIVERMVLEALYKKPKSIVGLKEDTGLDYGPLNSILKIFLESEMIYFEKGVFALNQKNSSSWLSLVNDKEVIKHEVKELFIALVNDYFAEDRVRNSHPKKEDVTLKVQKIWMNTSEERILQSYFKRIDDYLKDLAKMRGGGAETNRTSQQKVVMWGSSSYLNLVEAAHKAV